MRCKCKPGLKNERDNASPVDEGVHHGHLHDHVMESNMIHDEGKSVHERENKERVCSPAVKNLDLLMRDSCRERDPIRLACCCAAKSQ